MKMIQLVLAAIYIILHFIVSLIIGVLPAKLLSLIGLKKAGETWLRLNGSALSRGIVVSLGGKVIVKGLENIPAEDRKICFVSNHQSYIDIPMIVTYIPVLLGFVAKIELTKVPVLNSWMKALGCVFIDRSSARSSIKAIFDGVKVIKGGHPLVIFPEGTRSKGDHFGEFKAGSMKLATRAKATIIPITIHDSYKVMEQRKGMKLITPVTLTIHEPIHTAQMDDEELKDIPDKVFGIIQGS